MNKLLILLVILLTLAVLVGCSTEVRVPERVYIPVKCQIQPANSPASKAIDSKDFKGIYENSIAIQVFTESIEADLNFCIKGDNKQ